MQSWQLRGPWSWALSRELPQLYREFNGIDFGHAHLAETLLRSQDPQQIEQARLEILDFISFPESKSFRDQYPKFNTQIWGYHWLQAVVYDVQLLVNAS